MGVKITMMKKLAKKVIVNKLSRQVNKLRAKNDFKIIAIGGSIGKTSTKFALAAVLKQKYRVQFQEGNYNDIVSVPLIFFGLPIPSLANPLSWIATFRKITKQLKQPYPYDIVIVELGTDGPGQIAAFQRYIKADLAILTAITPEHMEFFKDLDDVATEELNIINYADKLLVNKDLVDQKYLRGVPIPIITYGMNKPADYQLANISYANGAYDFEIKHGDKPFLNAHHHAIAETQLYSVSGASAAAHELGVSPEQINNGIDKIEAVNGRMKQLPGLNNSVIIDDTYNASPVATKAALDTIYKLDSPQKIAILGNMNELGMYSEQSHREVGEYCDPKQLELVITIGPDANNFLAPAAQKMGCQVKMFTNPYKAGEYLKPLIKDKALILAKGSQNGVFAEETVKLLLADKADASHLVRQSNNWLALKQKAFKNK
jgi:UDP-N-acetylmuramoyl-tripeptide--D-alanyl-D-alanine ligase